MEKDEYLLGTQSREVDRLRLQHTAWVEYGFRLFRRADIRAGQKVADLGCGPGFTTMELARCVGADGHVIACDRSERFLQELREQCRRHEVRNVEAMLGDVEQLELAPASIDAAYARWLLCWVADPSVIIERLVRMLKPRGALVFQEYLDWAAMKLLPISEPFCVAVDACMKSWDVGKATINIAEQFPTLAARHGLILEHFEPVVRIGRVGSLEWRWVMAFLLSYLPGLVERGLLTTEELSAFEADYNARTADGTSFLCTPIVADVILRRPG